MTNSMTHQMNRVLSDWKSRFDILNQVSLPAFSCNQEDELCFKGFIIFPGHKVNSLILLSSDSTSEMVTFHFQHKLSLDLCFHWSEDQPAQLVSLCFGPEGEEGEGPFDSGFYDFSQS